MKCPDCKKPAKRYYKNTSDPPGKYWICEYCDQYWNSEWFESKDHHPLDYVLGLEKEIEQLKKEKESGRHLIEKFIDSDSIQNTKKLTLIRYWDENYQCPTCKKLTLVRYWDKNYRSHVEKCNHCEYFHMGVNINPELTETKISDSKMDTIISQIEMKPKDSDGMAYSVDYFEIDIKRQGIEILEVKILEGKKDLYPNKDNCEKLGHSYLSSCQRCGKVEQKLKDSDGTTYSVDFFEIEINRQGKEIKQLKRNIYVNLGCLSKINHLKRENRKLRKEIKQLKRNIYVNLGCLSQM